MVMIPIRGIAAMAILGAVPVSARPHTMDAERDGVIPAMDE